MLKKILFGTITTLHVLFLLFVIISPFFNSNYFLFFHCIMIPFILLHWILNDNRCMLTMVEKHLRKKLGKKYDKNDCFTCKLIEPVFDFKKNNIELGRIIYIITISLWLLSVCKMCYKYYLGKINNFNELVQL